VRADTRYERNKTAILIARRAYRKDPRRLCIIVDGVNETPTDSSVKVPRDREILSRMVVARDETRRE
jgi:hypothetical protein